jgi:hypothetical protein
MYLSRSARSVRVLVRGSSLAASMSSYLSSRLEADPAITIDYRAEVVSSKGTSVWREFLYGMSSAGMRGWWMLAPLRDGRSCAEHGLAVGAGVTR